MTSTLVADAKPAHWGGGYGHSGRLFQQPRKVWAA